MEISGAHFLRLNYESKCTSMHGHNWIVTVTVQNDKLDENGMVVDFTKIKDVVNLFDHRHADTVGNAVAKPFRHIFCRGI